MNQSGNNITRKEFIKIVGEKARAASELLTFGDLGPKFGFAVRDGQGLTQTFSNIYDEANTRKRRGIFCEAYTQNSSCNARGFNNLGSCPSLYLK